MELHNTCGSLGSDVIVAEFWETIFFIVEGGILFVSPPQVWRWVITSYNL